jgi:hypothetical protein
MTKRMHRLVIGTEIIPLECDRMYAVKLPPECSQDDVEQTLNALAHLRAQNPEHAPRFLVCRHNVDVEILTAGLARAAV